MDAFLTLFICDTCGNQNSASVNGHISFSQYFWLISAAHNFSEIRP